MNSAFEESPFTIEGFVLTGQPPIVGEEDRSLFLTRECYLMGNTLNDFGSLIEDGASFLFDIQSDSFEEQIILGSGTSDETTFRIRLHADDIPNRVELMLRDDDGRELTGYADTSVSRAKRLCCTADPRSNLLAFYELQPWVNDNLQTLYTKQNSPIHFSNLIHPLIIGGWNLDGKREGHYIGRIANVAIFNRYYGRKTTNKWKKASTNPTRLPWIDEFTQPDTEKLIRLSSDIKKMQKFSQQSHLEFEDFFDASIILYRWLLDTHPMIQEVCKAYGIQLWFYGESDAKRKYSSVILADKPTYYQKSSLDSNRFLGFKWASLETFVQEPSFYVDQRPISHSHFIGLIRNKLGGAHFDRDRSQIQRRLLELTIQFQLANQNVLYYQMHQLVCGVMEALTACGVIEAIQYNLVRSGKE